jgi:Domain of unknown function (DUF4070)
VILKSVWTQGVLSSYRWAYWRFWRRLILRWGANPQKRRLGFELALSGHHFIQYAQQVAETLDAETSRCIQMSALEFTSRFDGPPASLIQIDSAPGAGSQPAGPSRSPRRASAIG